MIKKTSILIIILCCCIDRFHAQFLKITECPDSLRMFARDTGNKASFDLRGLALTQGTVVSIVDRGRTAPEIRSSTVDSGAGFHHVHTVNAVLQEQRLRVYFSNKTIHDSLLLTVDGLLCGDFFLIDGQSNAECPVYGDPWKHDSIYRHPCLRTIGTNFTWATRMGTDSMHENIPLSEDSKFMRASCIGWHERNLGFSGVWGLKLQHDLALSTGIPNCVVNAAVGGYRIRQLLPSHVPTDPEKLQCTGEGTLRANSYDRAYYKFLANKVTKGVCAVFWYQGESDASLTADSAAMWSLYFDTLRSSLKQDYPGLRKIFVFQLNTLCGGLNLPLVREQQRSLPGRYPDVSVMCTLGSEPEDRAPDNCHYTIRGYSRIATRLLPLVQKELYGIEPETVFSPPDIREIYYSDNKKLCLRFSQKVDIQQFRDYAKPDSGRAWMKDYFLSDGKALRVDSVYARDEFVYLELNESNQRIHTLTYLPASFSRIPSWYSGPWICSKEEQDLKAFSFSEFPVTTLSRVSDGQFSVYPNPGTDIVRINFPVDVESTVKIFDSSGRIFLETVRSASFDVNIEKCPPGIYYLSLTSAEQSFHTMLVRLAAP